MKQAEHLRPLRNRLSRLCRRRRRFRWATAASAVAIAALWALAGVFALDWYFQRNVDLLQRVLLLALAAAGVIWAFVRFARPWLGKREDMTDMALLVQRQERIDSDLVAALQFESDDAAYWGSTELETAVIDKVATRQKKLNVNAAMPHQPLRRRLVVLAITALVWAVLGVFATEQVWVFLQRLAFGSQHYPSQTQVVSVKVNGKDVDLTSPGTTAVHVACGQPVRFEVGVSGLPPVTGRIELVQAHNPAVNLPLERGDGEQPFYNAKYPGLNQSAHYQVYLGDAWTDPLSLSVTPLPVVEIRAEVVPPVYARQSASEIQKLPRGMRQFPVLAGSEVHLRLESDRPLKSAEATIAGRACPLQREDAQANGAEIWTLAAAGTPLNSVAEETPYEIQVHDVEGQILDEPLKGVVTIEPDQPPGITASTVTPIVLPTGAPTIHYEAADDHALGRIWVTWEATSGDTTNVSEKRGGEVEVCRFPAESPPRNRKEDYRLKLDSLSLKPGDTLKVTFHVSDYRGPAQAVTVDADPPLVFQVTDQRGFEASMYDFDQKSSGVLEDSRKKLSGIGETQ